jgi:EAL domain-containing protein (putative c-di-GMP-specific phosphodiesterase class I)
LGLIQPGQFIALAEETGAISGIGEWVLREGCRQLRAWHERFPDRASLTLSVNLSPRQLSAPDLVAQVQAALAETGVAPASVRLEITESALMQDVDAAIETLTRLKTLGVSLHVDDFGTGYSSLSYLQRFPVSSLKIDRSFVSRMESHSQDAQIVRTIVSLAHSLGLDVIAEGVETAGQGAQLKALQCRFAQGHLFSEAVDATAAEALVRGTRPLRVTPRSGLSA